MSDSAYYASVDQVVEEITNRLGDLAAVLPPECIENYGRVTLALGKLAQIRQARLARAEYERARRSAAATGTYPRSIEPPKAV